jgi:hypothetical protein
VTVRGHHDAAGERTQAANQGGGEKKTGAAEHGGMPDRELLQETPGAPAG